MKIPFPLGGLLLLGLLLCSTPTQAQFSLSAQGNYFISLGGKGLNFPGLGLRGDYGNDGLNIFNGSIHLYPSAEATGYLYGNAISNQVRPSQIEVDYTDRISLLHLNLGYKRYFVGDDEEPFNLYVLVEAGLLLGKSTLELEPFDTDNYRVPYYEDGESEIFGEYSGSLGFGVEVNIGHPYLYVEPKLVIPSGDTGYIPFFATANVGVRWPFY